MDFLKADDRVTRTDGRIEGARANQAGERLYSTLEFSYRPSHPNETRRHTRLVEKTSLEAGDDETLKSESLAQQWIASRVTEWSLKDRGGHSVKVSPDAVAGLNEILFGRLYRIILGRELSDPSPGQDTLKKRMIALQQELDSVISQIEVAPLSDAIAPSDGELEGN